MAKSKAAVSGSFLQEMFQVGLYKRSQGRIARQVTFAAAAIVIGLGAYSLMNQLDFWLPAKWGSLQYVIAGGLAAAGWWISYRVVNYPVFADFLIAVEAEMAKVSWPSRAELTRAATVVIIVIFVLAAILYCYDIIWQVIFKYGLGVLK
jgi:preprotein translocase subunit SecE